MSRDPLKPWTVSPMRERRRRHDDVHFPMQGKGRRAFRTGVAGNGARLVIAPPEPPGLFDETTDADELCEDCPPHDYPTDDTRCSMCPRRANPTPAEEK